MTSASASDLLREVTAKELQLWISRNEAVVLDVRDADEFRREHLPGSRPAGGSVDALPDLSDGDGRRLVLVCSSGARSLRAGSELVARRGQPVWHLEGGIARWKQAGLPVEVDSKAPLPLMRQVQIIAGGLIVLGYVLGLAVSPFWHLLSGFVGAGLLMAGITGFCGLARVLMLMPWNKTPVDAGGSKAPAAG